MRFTGFEDEPRRMFAQADVFVLPSRVAALPLVLAEVVSAGLPAVTTDVGDVREALGDVVEVVPPEDVDALADSLLELIGDEERRRAMAKEARETARRYSLDAIGREWDALLADLL